MASSRLNPMEIVEKLAQLPHRGATTPYERQAADIIADYLKNIGATVRRQPFRTPKTYIGEAWWLIGGLVLGMALISITSAALILVLLSAVLAILHFDWRPTPVLLLPPRGDSENVIGTTPPPSQRADSAHPERKIILMAHYDSAPVSLLYLPSLVKNFRQSLLISLGLMAGAAVVSILEVLQIGQPAVTWIRYLLIVYFLIQGIMTTFDFVRYGYTNGASDNATGTAVAIATAERLWKTPIPGFEIELVLTGAEEVGMVGSRAYFLENRKRMSPENTFLINFDNMGRGDLKIIEKTGSITAVLYDNPLVDAAKKIATEDPRFSGIESGIWHTGDFDSVWFARADIPSLTLSAQEDGLIPDLHRPSDTVERVNAELPAHAVEFAERVIRHLAENADPSNRP